MKSCIVVRRKTSEFKQQVGDRVRTLGFTATYCFGGNHVAYVFCGQHHLGFGGRDAWICGKRLSQRRLGRIGAAMKRSDPKDWQSMHREFERYLVRIAAVNGARLVIEGDKS